MTHPLWLRAVAPVLVLCVALSACAEPEIASVVAPATPRPTTGATPTALPQVATATPAPYDDEPGISSDTIRIGVIADVEGALELGGERTIDAWQAIDAWAAALNADGGLAGRTIEVVPIDAQLFRHSDAIDLACGSDVFALVGSAALNDSDGLSQLIGPSCNLPDFPAYASTFERLQSPVTFVSNPVNAASWNAGWAQFYARQYPAAANAAATMLLEYPAAFIAGERMIEAATSGGLDFVSRQEYTADTDFIDEADQLEVDGARALVWRNSSQSLTELLAVLDERGVDLRFVDCGQACYSRSWVRASRPYGNGVSVWLGTAPFEDAEFNPELARYLFWLPAVHPDNAVPTAVGVEAWAAGLLFEEAVNRAVGAGTADYDPDSISRAGVIEAAGTITEWDARGLHGTSNPAEHIPSPCFTLLTLTAGQWRRVHPVTPGEADCDPENLVELQFTDTLGDLPEPELSTDAAPAATDEGLGGDGPVADG